MKNLLPLCFISLILFSSCNKEEQESKKKYKDVENLLWYSKMDESNEWRSMFDPIIYENIVVMPKINSGFGDGELLAYDKITGEELWKWSDARDKYGKNSGFSVDSYVHDGILAIGDNNYTAGINIYSGETLWEKLDTLHGLAAIRGYTNTIFKTSYIPNQQYWIQKADIHTGDWETIYQLKAEDGFNLGSNLPTPINWKEKLYLTFLRNNWKNDQNGYDPNYFLYLYNVSEDKIEWKSDTIPLEHPASGKPGVLPTFNEGKILLSNDAFYAYNIEDGSLEWRNFYGNLFTLTSRIAAKDGIVYGNNGDGYFVGLDVHTGNELFRTTTGGSPSRIVVHDNKCYLASVSKPDGNYLMVLDAKNGNVLEDINASDNLYDGAQFDWGLTVDPETGFLYTNDHSYFLCYDLKL